MKNKTGLKERKGESQEPCERGKKLNSCPKSKSFLRIKRIPDTGKVATTAGTKGKRKNYRMSFWPARRSSLRG